MIKTKTENINVMKGASARVLVITDALSKQPYDKGDVMSRPAYELFLKEAERNGFREEDFVFVTPCPPIPIELEGSESKIVKYITEYREEFLGVLEQVKHTCLAVLTLGKIGNRQLMGKAVQITKARGTFCTTTATGTIPVLPLLGPFHVLRRPELREIYDSDFRQLAALRNAGWSLESLMDESGTEGYKWTKDITHLLNSPPKGITVDCETLGLDWHSPDFRILTIAITNRKGVSYVMPVDVAYARDTNLHGVQTPEWMKNLTEQDVESIKYQIRTLLADPSIPVSGHNLKYDIHALSTIGIEVSNWFLDTMQLAFAVDENMTSKSLDDCARRWVPTHAGYADSFNKKTDKSRMDLVGHDEMLEYAGGDTDVTYRLTQALLPLAKEDAENYECFVKVQMPALRTFVAMERTGVRIDTEALEELGRVLDQRSTDLHAELLSEVPEPVLREFEGDWNFGSAKFLVACLFGPNAIRDPESGKRLKPIKFTASTEKMPPSERVPSTSIKDHLPYFEHVPFVRKLMEYSKLQKVRSTYVGRPESYTDKQVKRLISGSYPKVVVDILQANGIVLPKIKSERSRVKLLPEPVEVAVGEKTILVDQFGNVKSRIKTPCAGFWQYLGSGDNLIHTSFVLHATNTGRTACLRADSLVVTSSGQKRIDEVVVGDLVWTHKNRWKPVVRLFRKPVEQMFTVEFSNGSFLHCTLGHKVLTNCGKWLSLLDVCIKETSEESRAVLETSGSVQNDSFDDKAVGEKLWDNLSHSSGDIGSEFDKRGVCEVEVSEVLGVENGKSESDDWEILGESPEVQRRLFRWSRLLNENCGSKTIFRSSSRDGGSDRSSSIKAESSTYTPYRRESDEQLDRQSSFDDSVRTPSLSRTVSEESSGITIKRIEPCGSHTVYDFEVEEDHSYEAAGCFSHNSRNPNMQNTPKRGDMAKSFRKIFLPPIEGWKFLELDYSQVELRVAAWMANEKNMIQIYKDGGDIHSSTAAAVTNIPIRDFLLGRKDNRLLVELDGVYPSVTKYLQTLSAEKKSRMTIKEYFDLLRYQAKAVNFGYLYGMWWKGFKVYAKTDYGIDYTDQEAEATRVRFFKNYPSLERWHKSMKAKANQDGYVRALHGALRRLPNVESFDESIIGGAERQAVNAPVQRFASDLGLIAVSRLFRDAPKDMIRPVLFIHDAIVPCVHPDYVEEAASAIKYYMENPPLESWFGIRPPFPLTADVSWGDNLGEMQELEGVVAKKPSWFQSGEECPSQDPEMLKAWAIKKKRGIIVTD